MAQLPARHPEIHVKEDRMSAYPTLPNWATRASALAVVSAAALAFPAGALADGPDGHSNGNGKGHVEHGQGNGYGHDKDAKPNGNGKNKDKGDKPGKGPKDKECDGPDRDQGCGNDKPGHGGNGPDKPCDGPDRDKGCGNDKPGHDDNGKGNDPRPNNTTTVNVAPAASSSGPAMVIGSANSQRCLSRRYLRLRLSKVYNAKKAKVKLNGKRVKVRKTRKGLVARIDLRKRVKGTYVVRIAVLTRGNRLITATRRFRTCTPRNAPVTA
jgi:hypothetical protein